MTNRKQSEIHDPAYQPGKQAEARAERRKRYQNMTTEQMCQSMDDKELARNARRGGEAAIAEQERRERRAELDALREDRNRGYHPVGEAWRGIISQAEIDIGV